MSDSIEMPDNVIEIAIARSGKYLSAKDECRHARVVLDEELLDMVCRDCGARVNPIQWMIGRERVFHRHVEAYDRYIDAKAAYTKKTRCKCEHCGRITHVREPTPKEIEMERKARIAEGSLLEVKS
jgi:ribosomal protein S27E